MIEEDDEEEEEPVYSRPRDVEARELTPITKFFKPSQKYAKKPFQRFDRQLRREKRQRRYVRIEYDEKLHSFDTRCLRDPVIGVEIGSGEFGHVHDVQVKSKPQGSYVVKIALMDPYARTTAYDRGDWDREVQLQSEASRIGVAPSILVAFVCQDTEGTDFGFIVMDKIEKTLREYVTEDNPEDSVIEGIRDLLEEKLIALHSIGILHNDIRTDNVGLSFNSNGTIRDLLLIDFGTSTRSTLTRQFDGELTVVRNDDQWESVLIE